MKHIADIANNALVNAREEKEYKTMLDPLAVQLVEQIFVKMALLCRGFDAFYSDRNRLNAEKTQWILAFTKNDIRAKSQIQPALNKLEFHRYPNPPQLGEFLNWMKTMPEDIGFPCVDEAYQISILMNRQFSEYVHHDERVQTVIRHAINQIDPMSYRTLSAIKARQVFEHYYAVSLKQFMSGKLEVIKKALPEKAEPHPVDKEKCDAAREKCMEALRKMGIANKRTV